MRFRSIFAGLCLALVPAATSAAGLPELGATQTPAPKNPAALPDLVVVSVGRPTGAPSGCLGTGNTVVAVIANTGRTATAARAEVQLDVRARAPVRVWYAHTATESIPALAPGQQVPVTFSGVFFPPAAERIEVLVKADASARVAELSEANNEKLDPYDVRNTRTCSAANADRVRTIGEAPDLAVSAIRPEPVARRGLNDCVSTVPVTVTNRTGGHAGRPTVVVTLKQVGGTRPGRVFRAEATAERPVGPGESQDITVSFATRELYDALSDAVGLFNEITFEVDAVVTAHGAVPETRTDNNRLTRSVWVRRFMAIKPTDPAGDVAQRKSQVSPSCPPPLPFSSSQ